MKRPSAALVVASAALCFSIAGTGIAANRYLITSTKQIKPSVLAQLRGKPGPRGMRGVQGPTGAAGTFSTANLQTVTATLNLPAGSIGSQTASCPVGRRIVSGGYDSVVADDYVYHDAPYGTTGWSVAVHNPSASASTLTVYAICG